MIDKNTERAEKILRSLFYDSLPDELNGNVREWLFDGGHEDFKDKALSGIWTAEVVYSPKPSKRAHYLKTCVLKTLGLLPLIGEYKGNNLLRRWTMIGAAAVLIPIMVLVGMNKLINERAAAFTDTTIVCENITVSAPENIVTHHILPDGSQVWLKGGSEMSYAGDFNTNRLVDFKGEGYFAVSKNGSSPFRVETGELAMTVLGTEFSVVAWEGGGTTEVLLAEGSLEVETSGYKTVLEPDHKLTLDHFTSRFIVEEVDAMAETGWLAGMKFKDTPLKDALEVIASHFKKELEIELNAPLDELLNVEFSQGENLEQILLLISEVVDGFAYQITEERIYISHK